MTIQDCIKMEKLLFPKTMEEQLLYYRSVTDIAFLIIAEQKNNIAKDQMDRDAMLLFQINAIRCLSLLKLSENAINYENPIDKTRFSNLSDPYSMESIVRCQFEAFCNFNNIYIQTKTEEERRLKYELWVLAGLKYRQSFSAEEEANKLKKEDEAKFIEAVKDSVQKNPAFLNLVEDSKNEIQKKAFKRKDWKLVLDGNNGRFVGWADLLKNGCRYERLAQTYTQLSLHTHPSHVSVFQFNDLFKTGYHITSTIDALRTSSFFISFFIKDYCKYFPTCQDTFNNAPENNKEIVTYLNYLLREFTAGDISSIDHNYTTTDPMDTFKQA